MLSLLLDNASWRAFVQFLRVQAQSPQIGADLRNALTVQAREFIQANQELKSAIAERKRVAERLSQLSSIIDCSNDAIIIHTLDGTIVSWNVGAEIIYGYSANEVLGRSRTILFAADEPDEVPGMLEAVKRGERVQPFETVHVRKDRQRINVSMMISPVKDASDKLVGVVAITRDISDQKNAEERFYKAFNASPEPITISKLADGQFVDVNESFLRVTGFQRKDVIGRAPLELGFWDRAEDHAGLVEALNNHGSIRDVEMTFLAKSGQRRTGLNSAEVIEISGEKCILAIFKDITERKALEAQLRQAQKMESIGRLSGGIAHDFNNLLSVIIGYSGVLEDLIQDNRELRKGVQEIQKAGQRAAALTRQLLAFSRQQVLEPKVLNLNTVVAEMSKMLKRLIGENIQLITELDPEVGRVKADQGQIEQIVMNLVVNARDAMLHGGKLIIRTGNAAFDEIRAPQHASVTPGRYIVLTVIDTGVGMNKETQSHIFEPFYTTKDKDKGTGLGLSVVYGVVKQSGGHIEVFSEPAKGSAFTIYLPAVEDAFEEQARHRSPAKSSAGCETILLVEDEESLRELTRNLLRQSGYTVLEADSGAQAVSIASDHSKKIDLLLTDVVLPDMNGAALAGRISQKCPDVKVLFMSGYTDDVATVQGILSAGTFFLQKPFDPDGLKCRVREVLDSLPRYAKRAAHS